MSLSRPVLVLGIDGADVPTRPERPGAPPSRALPGEAGAVEGLARFQGLSLLSDR